MTLVWFSLANALYESTIESEGICETPHERASYGIESTLDALFDARIAPLH